MARLGYVSQDGTLRVVEGNDGRPVVELADGGDALGGMRWIPAIVQPDRYQNGVIYLEGWPQICDVLGVSEDTALDYSRFAVDPLPTRKTPRGMVIIADQLARTWWANRTLPERIYPYLSNEVVRIPLQTSRYGAASG